MAIIPGVFTCSTIDKITRKASDAFATDVMNAGKQVYSATVVELVRNQTARFDELKNTTSPTTVATKVWWTLDCDEVVPGPCTNSCDIPAGVTTGSDCKDYNITDCFEKVWALSETSFNNNHVMMVDVMAEHMSQKLKIMDEHLNQKAIAFLQANAGTNAYPNGYAVTGNCVDIPAASWTADIMAYMKLASYYNKFNTNVISTGSDRLWGALWAAQANNGTQMGGNDLAKFRSIYGNIVHDGIGFAAAAVPQNTYTWNAGSVALISKNFYTERVKEEIVNGIVTMTYSVASPTIPGVRYDVIHKLECDNSTSSPVIQWKHSWKMFYHGEFLLNPTGCDATRTGILCYRCV